KEMEEAFSGPINGKGESGDIAPLLSEKPARSKEPAASPKAENNPAEQKPKPAKRGNPGTNKETNA
ncbi:MAG: hypothetical protein PHW65_03440, partial [Dehalococcoidales bacterium]|nr:hypothetical protein [Dehalococcoidales bacterium]